MQRYFFDIQDGHELVPDEEGLELPDPSRAELEAAESLVGLMRDRPQRDRDHYVAIEVRTPQGPLFSVALTFTVTRSVQ